MSKIALSHSRLSTYQQCPLKFKLQFLDKAFPAEEESPHLVRGGNVHKALENYIIKKQVGEQGIPVSALPEVESTKPLIDNLFNTFEKVDPEAQVSVNNRWQKIEWFSKDSYYRAIIDVIARGGSRVFVGDFKTGKIRDYDGWGGQLHLTATITFHIFPEVEQVDTVYLYVDHKKTHKVTFMRDELPKLTEHFDKQYEIVNNDKDFKPKTNEFCKWCPATKAQCPYSRKL